MSTPPTATGRPGVFVIEVCYWGPPGDAERVLAPLRKLGTPLKDGIGPVDYVALQRSGDARTPATRRIPEVGFHRRCPAPLRELLDGYRPDPGQHHDVLPARGRRDRPRCADATAFPHRRQRHNMFVVTNWDLPSDPAPHVKYSREYWAKLEGHTNGYYTNEVADEPQKQVDENYQGNIARLVALKTQYDPNNLFRLNANVKPTV